MTDQPMPPEDPNAAEAAAAQPPTPAEASGSTSYSQAQPAASPSLGSANKLDLGIIGVGLLTFLTSMLPFYTVSVGVRAFRQTVSASAWHGFFGWFGVLAALVGAGLLLAHLLKVALPIPLRLAVLGAFALAAVCQVLALLVFPGGGCSDLGAGLCDGIHLGRGVGYWLTLLLTLGGLALSFLRLKADD